MNTAIRNAMPEERLQANAADPVKAPWSRVESLLATLIDEIRQYSWMYASVHSKNNVPRPEPIRRPGTSTKMRRLRLITMDSAREIDPRLRGLSDDEVRAKFEGMGRG